MELASQTASYAGAGTKMNIRRRRSRWLLLVTSMSGAVVWLDIITSPFIVFPIFFLVPVGLATWFLGRTAGVVNAVSVVVARFWVAVTFENQFIPFWAAVLNDTIRLVIFLGVVFLLSKIARQKHELEHRVEELEGILPICSFCKKIRNDEGEWEQFESYVTERSAAQFTHSVCTRCEELHYGSVVRPRTG